MRSPLLLFGMLSFLVLVGVSCVSQPPVPLPVWRVPEGFRIVGYFPSWSGDPEAVRYQDLTHIAYAFAFIEATGRYRPVDAPEKLAALVARAHAAGVKVLISVGGWNEGDTLAFRDVSADPELTKRFVEETLALLAAYHLDGVDIDWEFPGEETSAGFTAMVQALAEALHKDGLLVTLAVSAGPDNGQYISDEAWQAADWIDIMAYDDGFGRPPGVPHSSYGFTRSALDYWLLSRQLPPSKVVLGVPFYGRSLVDRHSRTYRSLLTQFPDAKNADTAGGFNYNGPDTMRAKIVNQARLRAGGVMIWQLNQDARGPSSLLALIFDTVKEPVE